MHQSQQNSKIPARGARGRTHTLSLCYTTHMHTNSSPRWEIYTCAFRVFVYYVPFVDAVIASALGAIYKSPLKLSTLGNWRTAREEKKKRRLKRFAARAAAAPRGPHSTHNSADFADTARSLSFEIGKPSCARVASPVVLTPRIYQNVGTSLGFTLAPQSFERSLPPLRSDYAEIIVRSVYIAMAASRKLQGERGLPSFSACLQPSCAFARSRRARFPDALFPGKIGTFRARKIYRYFWRCIRARGGGGIVLTIFSSKFGPYEM